MGFIIIAKIFIVAAVAVVAVVAVVAAVTVATAGTGTARRTGIRLIASRHAAFGEHDYRFEITTITRF